MKVKKIKQFFKKNKDYIKQFLDKLFLILLKSIVILFLYNEYNYKKAKNTIKECHGKDCNPYINLIFIFYLIFSITKDVAKLFYYENNHKTLLNKYKEYIDNNPEKVKEVIKGIKIFAWIIGIGAIINIIIKILEK